VREKEIRKKKPRKKRVDVRVKNKERKEKGFLRENLRS